jgi:hypothetical protein
MQIKSLFRDYYDFVANQYGGGDPSIKYIRLPFTKPNISGSMLSRDCVDIKQDNLIDIPRHLRYHSGEYEHHNIKWLAVNGYRYLMLQIKPLGDWCILNEVKHPNVWNGLPKKSFWDSSRNTTPQTYHGCFDKELVLISRKLNSPVFTYRVYDGYVSIDGEIPILKDIGFDKLISPEQLYQDISYFVGNIIKESPDMMPPTKMSDKEKILQHGFDIRSLL